MANLKGQDFDGDPVYIKSTGAGTDVDPHIIEHLETNSAAIKTAVELLDDAVFTDDTSTHATGTTKGLGIMAVATPTDTAVAANDIGMIAMSLDRRMLVDAQIVGTDAALDVSAATVTVTGTVTANAGTGTLTVDLGANNDVTVQGEDAENAAVTAAPVLIGGRYDATPRTLGNGDAGAIALDADGAVQIADGGNSITVDGTVTANAGTGTMTVTDDGSFDIASVIPGTGATSLGKAIGGAAGATDTGVAPLAIRDDTLTTLSDPEGDYIPLRVSSTGALHVTGSAGVTEYTEDTAHNTGDTGNMTLVVRSDAGGSLVSTDGDYAPLQVDSSGQLRVTGGGGGTEYNEDVATPATIIGSAILIERDDALSSVTPAEGDWIGLRGNARGALWTANEGFYTETGDTMVDDTNDALNINVVAGDALGDIYVEDAATPATIEGPTLMMERDDALATLTPIEGDWVAARSTHRGALWTAVDDIQDGNGSSVMDTVNNSVQVSVVSGNALYNEDAATPSTILGQAIVGERDDALSTLTPIEGDWAALRVSAEGALWTQDFNSDSMLTALQLIDDVIFTDDISTHTTGTTKVAGIGAVATPTDGSVGANDIGMIAMSTDRRLHVDAQIVGQDADITVGHLYTEDAVAPADPEGPTLVLKRADTPGPIGVDNDMVAQRATAYGAAYVQILSSSGSFIDSFGGGTQYAEDAAHNTGDTGTMALVVRSDAGGALAGTDGDYSPLQVDSAGALRVTGGGGGTEYNEDVATPATIVGTATLMERDDALSTVTPIEGDWIGLRGNARGALWVELDGTNAVTVDNGGTFAVQVDAALPAGTNAIGKLAANSGVDIGDVDVLSVVPGVGATNLGKAEDAAHTSGDVGVMALSVRTNTATARAGTDGDYQPLITDTNGRLHVITTASVAHDATASSNTLQTSLAARSTDITAVGSGDAVRNLGTLLGKSVNHPFAIPARYWDYTSTADVTDTADDVAQAAGGAGVRHYITGIYATNSHASVDTYVVVKDGSTVKFRQFCKSGGGGISAPLTTPIRCTANTAVNVANITTGSATSFTITGFTAAE